MRILASPFSARSELDKYCVKRTITRNYLTLLCLRSAHPLSPTPPTGQPDLPLQLFRDDIGKLCPQERLVTLQCPHWEILAWPFGLHNPDPIKTSGTTKEFGESTNLTRWVNNTIFSVDNVTILHRYPNVLDGHEFDIFAVINKNYNRSWTLYWICIIALHCVLHLAKSGVKVIF